MNTESSLVGKDYILNVSPTLRGRLYVQNVFVAIWRFAALAFSLAFACPV